MLFFCFFKGAFTQIKCSSEIYIGGVPSYDAVKKNSGITRPFSGSIQKVSAQKNTLEAFISISSNAHFRWKLALIPLAIFKIIQDFTPGAHHKVLKHTFLSGKSF